VLEDGYLWLQWGLGFLAEEGWTSEEVWRKANPLQWGLGFLAEEGGGHRSPLRGLDCRFNGASAF
jgi:hypothetical protein